MDFYPEDNQGMNCFKFLQSLKWREALSPQMRAQMVEIRDKHFYIFEPVQIRGGTLVVPIFYYTHQGEMFARCVTPRQKRSQGTQVFNYLIIPSNLDYQSLDLIEVKCEDFMLIYSEIQIGGVGLSEWCGGALWGESNLSSFS